MLIVITGVPGSGKSTFAKRECNKHPGSIYLDLDDFKNVFIGEADRSNTSYQEVYKPKIIELVNKIISTNEEGTFILEGTFWDKLSDPYWYLKEFKDVDLAGHQIVLKRCVAKESTIRARLINRDLERDKAKLKDENSWSDFLKREPIFLENFKGEYVWTEPNEQQNG